MFGCRSHKSADKRLDVAAHAVPGQLLEWQRVGPDHVAEQGGLRGKGGRRGQHAVCHLAEGPHVTSSVVELDRASPFVGEELGSHVRWCALDRRKHLGRALDALADAEVADLDPPVSVRWLRLDQDVL